MTANLAILGMLSDYFGSEEKAIEFMRSFPGITIPIPPLPTIEKMVRDRQIARSLQKNPDTDNARRLSGLHNIDMRTISKSFAKQHGKGIKKFR